MAWRRGTEGGSAPRSVGRAARSLAFGGDDPAEPPKTAEAHTSVSGGYTRGLGAEGALRRVLLFVCVGGGGGWHKASVSDCLPLAAPIGLSPLLILTPCGPERVLVVSTEPPDDLSRLTTPGVGRPGDGAVARAVDQVHPDAHSESMRRFADASTDLSVPGCASAG